MRTPNDRKSRPELQGGDLARATAALGLAVIWTLAPALAAQAPPSPVRDSIPGTLVIFELARVPGDLPFTVSQARFRDTPLTLVTVAVTWKAAQAKPRELRLSSLVR